MHHKNKRTVQKEVKRLDHKSARAKARTALDGGPAQLARSTGWSNTVPQPPITDEVGRHKSRKKKPTVKKQRCPINGTHEWYREVLTETRINRHSKPGYWKCVDCRALYERDAWYDRHYCPDHLIEDPYEVITRLDTCIHCWAKREKVTEPDYWRLYSRQRPYKPRTAYRRSK